MENKLLYSGIDLRCEWQQCYDEGKDVIGYKDECEKLAQQLENKEPVQEAALEFIKTLVNAPQRENFFHTEPSTLEEIKAARPEPKQPRTPKKYKLNSLRKKLEGAWTGRTAGCLLGKPFEGILSEQINKMLEILKQPKLTHYVKISDFSEKDIEDLGLECNNCWIDKVKDGFPVDDDLNYTVFALRLINEKGRNFTPQDVIDGWLRTLPVYITFTAERLAYRNRLGGLLPPETATYFNPYREYIGAQIRGDYFGYINPGDPEKAAEYAWRDASVSHVKNGIYGEMFIAAMLAQAAVSSNFEEIIQTGLKEIPVTSRLYSEVRNIIGLYYQGKTWEEICANIHSLYDEKTNYGWCHTNANAMIVVASLLYGEGDFGKSICLAVQSGYDTDCNGATVGSIFGMARGIDAIDESWIKPFESIINTAVAGYTRLKISQAVSKTLNAIKTKEENQVNTQNENASLENNTESTED